MEMLLSVLSQVAKELCTEILNGMLSCKGRVSGLHMTNTCMLIDWAHAVCSVTSTAYP
jgi:hypothetical protein